MTFQKPPLMPEGYNGWSLIDGEDGINLLKNTLYNLSSQANGDDHRYAQGVLVGVCSCLMAGGMSYEDATQLAFQCSPNDIHPSRVPEYWRDQFESKLQFRVGQRFCYKHGSPDNTGRITKKERGVIFYLMDDGDTGTVVESAAGDYLIVIKQENNDEKPRATTD